LRGPFIALRLTSSHAGRKSISIIRRYIRFSTVRIRRVLIVSKRITETALRKNAAGHAAIGFGADLDPLPVSAVATNLENGVELVFGTTMNVGHGTLFKIPNERMTIAPVGHVGLSEAVRRLGTLLVRLPVSMAATYFERVFVTAVDISYRALRVALNQSMAGASAFDVGLSEAVRSLGALHSCLPVAIIAAGQESVVVTALSTNYRALLCNAGNGRKAATGASGCRVGGTVRGIATLFNRLPLDIFTAPV
jgi:hypothetical protein